jgi:hypothetical protein
MIEGAVRMPSFEISSNVSARKIVFSDRWGDGFFVELLGHGLNASMKVSAYTDAFGLLRWLERLAECHTPWEGEDDWQTLEGEFRMSARCSVLGNVLFQVHLWGLPGAPEEWRVSAGVESDLGSLPRLAEAARRFFSGPND